MSAGSSPRPRSDEELRIVRTFDAPASLLFRIWSEAEHLIHWLGPTGFICTHAEADFRVGGAFRGCIVSQDPASRWRLGRWMTGRYREIARDARIVFTFAWEDGGDQPGVDTLVTLTFEEKDGRTVQTFHQARFLHVEERDSHVDGWTRCFDREQAHLERLQRSERA